MHTYGDAGALLRTVGPVGGTSCSCQRADEKPALALAKERTRNPPAVVPSEPLSRPLCHACSNHAMSGLVGHQEMCRAKLCDCPNLSTKTRIRSSGNGRNLQRLSARTGLCPRYFEITLRRSSGPLWKIWRRCRTGADGRACRSGPHCRLGKHHRLGLRLNPTRIFRWGIERLSRNARREHGRCVC
jgi:hypothetical protein